MASVALPGPDIKFDADARARFLAHYAKTGRKYESAKAAGVGYETYRQHYLNDESLRAKVADAHKDFLDTIEQAIQRRGVLGWYDETTTLDKDTGAVIKKTKRYKASDKLLLAYAKRNIKAYREAPPTVTTGVVVNTQVNVNFEAMDAGQRASLRAFLEAVKAKPLPVVDAVVVPSVETNGHANGHANGTTPEE